MGLAADLIKYDRDLEQQDADEEYRDEIIENLNLIRTLSQDLSFENLIKIRSAAQDIIDDCNRRLP